VDETLLKCHVPVFAIQSLVENAIKHNALSERKPLLVSVRSEAGCILVSNPRQPKPLQVSSGTGLQNLANRYHLMFNRSIEVLDDENTFTVRIPVLCP
jgi:LytS/YehU family sensor histidine kinase